MLTNQYVGGYYLNSDGVASMCTKVGDYEFDKATGTIVRYTGNDVDVVVPKTIDGVEIKSIISPGFSKCKTISSITIPASITNINPSAFEYCESLSNINIDEANKNYSSVDGVLFNKIKTTLIRCPEGKITENYVIPGGVIRLEGDAFEHCYSLKVITVPGSLQYTGMGTFDIRANTKFYTQSEATKYLLNKSASIDASKIELVTGYYNESYTDNVQESKPSPVSLNSNIGDPKNSPQVSS